MPPTGDPEFESVSLNLRELQEEEEEIISGDEQLQVKKISAEFQEKGKYPKRDVSSQKVQFEDTSFGEFEEQGAGKEEDVGEETKEAEETFYDETQLFLQVSSYQ